MQATCVIGLGYIGLPTALILAAHGQPTIGVDIDQGVINSLQSGQLTFSEEGLDDLFVSAQANITFTTQYPKTNTYIVAVPTPFNFNTKKIDPTYVKKAVSSILAVCEPETTIVIESTIAPSTIDRYIRPLVEQERGDKTIHLAHAPERIMPGRMVYELVHNARVIGADSDQVAQSLKKLYQSFCQAEIVTTDIRSAEMSKVIENTYRDINIAFANELTKICRQDNLNVYEIIRIANMHPRVNILQPGPGVGGHCISVDPWFLVGDYPQKSLLIHEARKINDSMPHFVLERVQDIIQQERLDNPTIGFYGITYKEDVDDTRESPTLQLYESMRLNLGLGNGKVLFYDPLCETAMLQGQVDSFERFLSGSDIVVIMVAHTHIKENQHKLVGKPVLDTKHIGVAGAYGL